ncbi:hypothetical protein [Chthoniobacter flavus]|nr:hypothetical protein [Chthoniobacter flavus]
MTVAYGLSFDFFTLDRHRLPEEIDPLPVDSAVAKEEKYHAPTKDEV